MSVYQSNMHYYPILIIIYIYPFPFCFNYLLFSLTVVSLCGGELLDQVVSSGSWTEGQAAAVIKKLLVILQSIHAHDVVHMDIKVYKSVILIKSFKVVVLEWLQTMYLLTVKMTV